MSGVHERDRDPLNRRLRARLGRRGASLMFFGAVDLLYAAALACTPSRGARAQAAEFLTTLLPMVGWALPWAAVGVVCAVWAWREFDRFAFVAASALCVFWAVLNLTGWLFGAIPHGGVSAVIWGGYAAFIQVIAGWPEPLRGG